MKRLFLLLLLAGPMAMAQLQQPQQPQQPQQLTVSEFLKLSPNDTTSYLVHGVVSKMRSSTSGSFYLKDQSGTLLVYGIQDPRNPSLIFDQLDIVEGDTLTVRGRFTVYNGTTKEMKDGRLISKADGPDHNLSFYDRLDRRPIFKGKEGKEGVEAFKAWVQANLKKPANGATGTVKVRFVVGKNGGVQEVQVLGSPDPALSEEAVRVVRSSPKWRPARKNGTTLRMTYTIPVIFE